MIRRRLKRADRMNMANPLEVRAQLLDPQLAEWVTSLATHRELR